MAIEEDITFGVSAGDRQYDTVSTWLKGEG